MHSLDIAVVMTGYCYARIYELFFWIRKGLLRRPGSLAENS